MLRLLDDDGSSSSFLGYVASNKLPHLISIGLRIKYVSFSYGWPLVKLRKQTRGSWNDRCTVSLFTFDGNNKIGLLQFSLEPWEKKRSVPVFPPIFLLRTLQQRNGRKTPPVQPGTLRKQEKCPGVPPVFLLWTWQQRNERIFLVEGVIALIYRFFFSHHFRHHSHASSVQRRSMQTGTADS